MAAQHRLVGVELGDIDGHQAGDSKNPVLDGLAGMRTVDSELHPVLVENRAGNHDHSGRTKHRAETIQSNSLEIANFSYVHFPNSSRTF